MNTDKFWFGFFLVGSSVVAFLQLYDLIIKDHRSSSLHSQSFQLILGRSKYQNY